MDFATLRQYELDLPDAFDASDLSLYDGLFPEGALPKGTPGGPFGNGRLHVLRATTVAAIEAELPQHPVPAASGRHLSAARAMAAVWDKGQPLPAAHLDALYGKTSTVRRLRRNKLLGDLCVYLELANELAKYDGPAPETTCWDGARARELEAEETARLARQAAQEAAIRRNQEVARRDTTADAIGCVLYALTEAEAAAYPFFSDFREVVNGQYRSRCSFKLASGLLGFLVKGWPEGLPLVAEHLQPGDTPVPASAAGNQFPFNMATWEWAKQRLPRHGRVTDTVAGWTAVDDEIVSKPTQFFRSGAFNANIPWVPLLTVERLVRERSRDPGLVLAKLVDALQLRRPDHVGFWEALVVSALEGGLLPVGRPAEDEPAPAPPPPDPWLATLARFAEGRAEFNSRQVLDALGLKEESPQVHQRIKALLSEIGFEKKERQLFGHRERVFVRREQVV